MSSNLTAYKVDVFVSHRGKCSGVKYVYCVHMCICGSIMLWGCFAAGGSGAFHKPNFNRRKEDYGHMKATFQDTN